MSTVVAMMIVFATTCSFWACAADDEGEPNVKPDPAYASSRTVMVYMIAENSMDGAVASDVREMLSGMRDSTLYEADRLVIYVDDASLPRIYVIDKNTRAASMADLEPVMTYKKDVNSSSAEQLASFIDDAKSTCPAESYGLVMWSHGSGWLPSTYAGDRPASAARKTIGVDNGKNNHTSADSINIGNQMEMEDLASVLEQRGGVDFLFFDACFMQCVEVCYTLRNAAKHIIASPAEIPYPGAAYETMTRALFRKEDYAERMLSAYDDAYLLRPSYGVVIADVNTEALPAFASYMKTLVANHREGLLAVDFSGMLLYNRYEQWSKEYPDFPDMQGVMSKVLNEEEFAEWQAQVSRVVTCQYTTSWYSALKKGLTTVIPEQCCGLSMFVPRPVYDKGRYQYNTLFLSTEWAKDVWGE